MASPIETPSWEREVLCGCKGCAVARKPLQDAIQRVRDLHYEFIPGCCHACPRIEHGRRAWASYPCPTIRALDGE